jgi:hypothetical protein
MTEQDGPPEVRRVAMPAETLVMEDETQRQLLWVDGYMPLPPGSRLELNDFDGSKADAEVVRLRLWGADSGKPTLVLDVILMSPGEFTGRP